MMTVVGEEGTSIDDFVIYLKAEFFDAVYLQQNAFDEVDAAVPSGAAALRLRAPAMRCCRPSFGLEDKEQAAGPSSTGCA